MAMIRLPLGRIRDDADIVAMMRAGYQETVDVGRARGVTIPGDAVERTLAWNRNAPATLLPSMAVDLMRGNRIELPWLSGKIVALGRELGVPTPTHALMYAALKPYVMGAPT
jgi:2-dehydropantoate 2-reductase